MVNGLEYFIDKGGIRKDFRELKEKVSASDENIYVVLAISIT